MNNEQLELGINGNKLPSNGSGYPAARNRQARAGWWFAQMRNIVSRAMDWENTGEPRPEQIWIPGAHREVEV
ncbi:MAG TPA: hypothetical protein VMJ12_00340 [Candidatus Acidoferrales bacterium]|nr:hypothetical protein [Candidatus Acidoferrales bacterium]